MRKVLIDIETSFNQIANWSLWQKFHGIETIIKDRALLCMCFKEHGKGEDIHYYEVDVKDPYDDEALTWAIYEELKDADVLIFQNGDKFDLPFIKARMLKWGVPPLPPIVTADTLKMLKSEFYLNSNKLDYVSGFIGREGKLATTMQLWKDICLDSSPLKKRKEAMEYMVEYCAQDIIELEAVYDKIAPYATKHPSFNLIGGVEDGCPTCGSTNLRTNDTWVHHAVTRSYARYRCGDCGAWCRSTKMLGKVTKRSV